MNRLAPILLSSATVLAGCAAPITVRGLGTGGAPPAYELRGGSLAALDAQSRLLCPDGFNVLRQWQRLHRQALAPNAVANWVAGNDSARAAISGVLDDGEAQLTVQCAAPAVK